MSKNTGIVFDYNQFKELYEAQKDEIKKNLKGAGVNVDKYFPDAWQLSGIVSQRLIDEGNHGNIDIFEFELKADDWINASKVLKRKAFQNKVEKRTAFDISDTAYYRIKYYTERMPNRDIRRQVLRQFEILKIEKKIPRRNKDVPIKGWEDINKAELARRITGLDVSDKSIKRYVHSYIEDSDVLDN